MCLNYERFPVKEPYVIAYKLVRIFNNGRIQGLYSTNGDIPLYENVYKYIENWNLAKLCMLRYSKYALTGHDAGFHACINYKDAEEFLKHWILYAKHIILDNKFKGMYIHTSYHGRELSIVKVLLRGNLVKDYWQIKGDAMKILEVIKHGRDIIIEE